MSERAEALQPLGHSRSEPLFARQLRYQEHVLRRAHLVRPVGPAELLDGPVRRPRQLYRDVHAPELVRVAAIRLQGNA